MDLIELERLVREITLNNPELKHVKLLDYEHLLSFDEIDTKLFNCIRLDQHVEQFLLQHKFDHKIINVLMDNMKKRKCINSKIRCF